MRTIWNFPLGDGSPQVIRMPVGAEILTVQVRGDRPYLWAIIKPVPSSPKTEYRHFEVFGTGQDIHEDMGIDRRYIGTFQQPPYVWHVFERIS